MNKPVTPVLLADADLNNLVISVCKQARASQVELQQAIVQCVLHVAQHNNTAHITKLLNDLPNSSRVKVIMAYIKAFTPIKFAQAKDIHGQAMHQIDGRAKVYAKLRNKSVLSDWKLDDMQAVAYYDWAKPSVEKEVEFDLVDTLKAFIKRIDNALAKGTLEAVKADNVKVQRALADAQLKALVPATI